MPDRETLIKAVECRKTAHKRCGNPCERTGACAYAAWIRDPDGTPYYPYYCDTERLCEDILALLREQEPRVMTAEEIQEDELVWIEVPQSDEIWPALLRESDWFDHPTWVMRGYALAAHYLPNRYGKDWRCWTARPTDEQREAVKWNETN